ncbi:50S ribosomal protein L25/general stress protein Ctc [Actinotignum urinale]|uniref:Large ribosomal subunit protein bL25 n=1 Tax=Actinotignum urinale TaxID=190146 RepID=A0ABU5G7T9_9ACTO|nr:50S ribosomal protein L25/general stress protein Ctc [Actinotignum urinale]MDY5132989.1 50S ribosomal protein L25/general stress protein Ctc [Actinotignum urinale]MDY5159709.1 50S ribosomal protein L25/general stress protein Ctc [Actinotignum urinale]WIK58488.1 50S ribosomal protein L25/general stress protein Ctc [Actinotignum urinale]
MAIESTKLEAVTRKEFGKGASRRMRRDGNTPAVLYGHGEEPQHMGINSHDVFLATKGNANALVTVCLEGEDHLALVKDIQRNPLTRNIEHIDLLRVKRDEKVEVEVPVEVVGEPESGLIYTIDVLNVLVMAPAIDIPETIVADVEGLGDGERVTVADLKHADDVEVLLPADEIIVSVILPEVEASEEEADAEDEAKAEESAAE